MIAHFPLKDEGTRKILLDDLDNWDDCHGRYDETEDDRA